MTINIADLTPEQMEELKLQLQQSPSTTSNPEKRPTPKPSSEKPASEWSKEEVASFERSHGLRRS